MMRIILVTGLLCVVITKSAATFDTGLAIDLELLENSEDRGASITEDRARNEGIFKLEDKLSDKFAKSGDFEEDFAVRTVDEHEKTFKFNDFADDAAKHDLAKSSTFDIRLKDENSIDKSDEVHSKRGTNLDKTVKSKDKLALDSKVHDKEKIASEHDSEKARDRARKHELESLFSDGFESLFDRSSDFEFGNFHRAHPKRVEPAIVQPGEDIIVQSGDEIVINPGDDIIVRTDGDVVVNPADALGETIVDTIITDLPDEDGSDVAAADPVDALDGTILADNIPVLSDKLDLEEISAAAKIETPQALLRGRLADVLKYRRVGNTRL